MTKSNFKAITKKELWTYVLAHRDDDEAFYAYADRIYEATATAETAIMEWLQFYNSYQAIAKIPESSSRFVVTDISGNKMGVKVQIMMSSLPTHKPFIDLVIEDLVKDRRHEFASFMTIFVSKNETNATKVDKELLEANFNSRAKSSRIVGYVDPEGKFQNI